MFPSGIGLLSAFHRPSFVQLSQRMMGSSVVLRRSFHSFIPTRLHSVVRLCACTSKGPLAFNSNWNFERKVPVGSTEIDSLRLARGFRYNEGSYASRSFSTSSDSQSSQGTEGEVQLKDTIRKCFPNATNIQVEDISGGCGSMFSIFIEAPDFQGLSTVKQHLLVNKALQKEIKSMHGIRIQTAASK